MGSQPVLPAGWARAFVGLRDPGLADEYGLPARDVDLAMLAVDDSIGDLVYDIERGLNREIEGEEPL